jgi:hypothetical protein
MVIVPTNCQTSISMLSRKGGRGAQGDRLQPLTVRAVL